MQKEEEAVSINTYYKCQHQHRHGRVQHSGVVVVTLELKKSCSPLSPCFQEVTVAPNRCTLTECVLSTERRVTDVGVKSQQPH
jgi:hypothetical protein